MTSAPALSEAKRQVTADRVLAAACGLLMERGLDITMDDIAAASGIGRRTLFRHFDSRDALLAAALEYGIEQYSSHLPSYDGDWRQWLHDLCVSAHQMQAGYGPGYWDLTSRTDLPAELAAAEKRRRALRRKSASRIADTLWRESGHADRPPAQVVTGIGAHLSPRFTAAVVTDAGATWSAAASLAYDAILSLLRPTEV